MIDLDRFTQTIEIAGEECRYDPEAGTALVQCENCSNFEEVEVTLEGSAGTVYGFMCSQCGHFNQPCE